MPGTRILIVDDHAAFRTWARALLSTGGFDVVGEAADGADALRRVRSLVPDVVLLDVQLPDLDGFDVERRLRSAAPAPAVILTSTRDAADYAADLAQTDAPFVPKADLTPAAIRAALRLRDGDV